MVLWVWLGGWGCGGVGVKGGGCASAAMCARGGWVDEWVGIWKFIGSRESSAPPPGGGEEEGAQNREPCSLQRRCGAAGAALERRLSGAVFNLSNKTRLENPLERRWSGA